MPPSNQTDDVRSSRQSSGAPLKPSVPTIPRKEQSYGYEQDPRNGELRLQAQPSHIYSGLGQDTVGPAAYAFHAETIWDDRKNVAPSIRSSVKRDVWEEYNTPRREVPGPGQYNPVGTHRIRGGRVQAPERPSAVFASRVPLLPDPKRPDQYDPERELELVAKELRAPKRVNPRSKVEAFGSTTGRTDIAVQLSAPYTSPTFKATPGPGKYASPQAPHFSGGSLKRAGRRGRDDQQIGFTSATERQCLTKVKPSSSPGPGAYKSETPRTVSRDVKTKQTVGRFGVFGSTSERRIWEQLETMEPEARTPGPGAYAPPVETHGGHFPLLAGSAAFKSSSLRFAKRENPHASPHVLCVGETTAPAVGQYNLTVSLSDETLPSSPVGGMSPPPSARAPFLSTVDRSVFDPKEAQFVPGPGQYTADGGDATHERTRSREIRATLGNEARFRVRPRVPAHVGPGAYAIPGTVGTKSFNVTMAQKATR
jgi:hypothetical protein